MTVSHRASADVSATLIEASQPVKVARMACCCKLADLLPLVQQMHRDAARAAAQQPESKAA
ncbi:hypothetical protein [Hymenobacter weizhouensis]|uniref:hypothetical protein n=1 Tax=Hymenobacter sp. YIM 151500-1 TaxID=2987689 RepID=UPI002226B901|nr:hypothetical protein [Hymenobacter sp. YIM 151500-1]UYZ61514.1 hypothetical protein OIS53_10885 [Hymenobacter sp. YIM 151500-1]